MTEKEKEPKKAPRKPETPKETPKKTEIPKKEEVPKKDAPKVSKEEVPKEKAPKKEVPKKEESKKEEKPAEKTSKKKEEKEEEKKILKESIHTVPLRKAFEKPQKKTRRAAINEIRSYLRKHTRKEPKIAESVNQTIWDKNKPPRKIKIKIVEEEAIATAELP
ncbi:hypothetical protein K8R43_06030 [archaeon]|nr:hypothetical protein [archaeon]